MTDTLEIAGLHVSVEGKPILRGVDLRMERGETHALMGPNGSGKSTLGLAVMGHPNYEVTAGSIELNGENVLGMSPEERARAGLFLAFQRPIAIPGVKMADFLRHATTNVRHPERKEGEEGGDYHLLERASGSFRRSFTLPRTVAGSEATATLDNGVLDIRLPKTPDAAGHRIKISKN